MTTNLSDSDYTRSVQSLINQIQQNSTRKDSFFELAQIYYTSCQADAGTLRTCQANLKGAEEYLETVSESKREYAQKQVKKFARELKDEEQKQTNDRQLRYKCLANICVNVLRLTEGKNLQQTNLKSSKLLATLFMLSSTESSNRQQMHHLYKPLYKAVLSLRLLDKMLLEGKLNNTYITSRFDSNTRFSQKAGSYSQFQLDVAIPVIIAALLQDIGMQHPEAQRLLKGADSSQDEFRVLEKETRTILLIINHEQTQDFLTNGIGISKYEGDDPEKKQRFEKKQLNRMKFVSGLLLDAVKPSENSIGNIIKIPQIYSSFVLSTKPTYRFLDLPNVVTVLNNSAKHAFICSQANECFIQLVGYFPLGLGVLYVQPHDIGEKLNNYFYGIVTRLSPEHPKTPTCRRISISKDISDNPKDFTLLESNNLFFDTPKHCLDEMSPEDLVTLRNTHMRQLNETKLPEINEGFWNPHHYFSISKHQILWD
ncbi:hypothetical protein [Paraglaciecola sp. 2405UD69-4]|uniref:hypothetical protein n=1 Tax=Paraglaciecola sp. 2405UD69-4 TaxID=3391836 RepID=UPI0039C8C813